MPSLREVQQAIRASIVEPDDKTAASFVLDDGLAPAQRICVYRNTFASNLANALRLSFPAIRKLVGTEFFDGAARIFVHERPPVSAYLDAYGSEFPDFLARFPPAASVGYLADVARLEWAVTCALHASDVEPLDVSRLAGVAPSDHHRVCFMPHPSVGLVKADHSADTIWRAVLAHDDAALAALDLTAGPVRLLVHRSATGVEITRIDEPTWRFTEALVAGQPLGIALDHAGDADAPKVLAEHIAAGRVVAFSLADALSH